ncbi:MAG TPA: Xaa-Pro peptidase family protein, partial [Bryobacteraceae bacterium]|nr:Xaa-Pro peptidase family protein [Bryobacteraceae bacterium]
MTEVEQRRRAASARLPEWKVDALLVSSPANLRYLTGYSGSNGLLLLGAQESDFFTDPRYGLEASSEITCRVHVAKGPLITSAAAVTKRKRLKKIGFETAWLKHEDFVKLREAMPLGVSLVAVGREIEKQRMVKSPDEIARIRASVAANSEAYERVLRRIRPGVREQDVAAELDFQMRMLGAERPAFETIVAAGIRTALPHARPSARRLESNELLLIDMGATLDGYASDMTRMAFAGSPPRRLREMYRAVLEAQGAAIEAVRPGIAASKVDAAARGVLQRHKLDKMFVHSTGHGLGLEIHEPPRLGKKEKT